MILAHGAGTGADLPAEPWMLAYAAAAALLICAAALRILWSSPRLAEASSGAPVPSALDGLATVVGTVFQLLAFVLFAVTLAAAWFGEDAASVNIAPTALYVALWGGMQVTSALLGDVWRRSNPLWTIAASLDHVRHRDPEPSTATGWWASHWPAALGLFAFHWLELVYSDPTSVAAVALFLSAYVLAILVGASRFGAGWVRTGDGFAVLFSLLASLSPLFRDDRGRLRLRVPGTGLAAVHLRPGTLAVLLVVLGGTAFDGVTRTGWWGDVVGGRRQWDLVAVSTVGLVLTIATVAVAYLVAIRTLGVLAHDDTDLAEQARRWGPSLVPIVLAYSIAHHVSLLVFEGQGLLALVSDPFGSGRDLFGTARNTIDFTVVTGGQIVGVQLAAIIVGHAIAVIATHDRALERHPLRRAVASQTPLLAVIVGCAVAGVLLLLDA